MINRRQLLQRTALSAAALTLSPWLKPLAFGDDAPAGGARKKVLFFTKSSGYQHSVITRPNPDPEKQDVPVQLAYAEQILTDFGAKNGYDVTCSKDGEQFGSTFDQYDVIVFYTTGDLTKPSDKYGSRKDDKGKDAPDPTHLLHRESGMPAAAKDAFLQSIANGKGFIGFHCAADTFHSAGYAHGGGNMLRDIDDTGKDAFDPYIQMLGGEFIIHGAQQKAILKAIDPKFPGAQAFNDESFVEEWYSLKNFATDLHVILAQDCTGMDGWMYQRGPYPETWARMHGKGRVFYSSMGHREDIWKREDFLTLVKNALDWTTGKIDADVAPNIDQATPGANVQKDQLPPKP